MRLEEKITLAATPSQVWDVVKDPCLIGRLSELMHVEQLDSAVEAGVGARYRVLLDVGPVPVGGNVEIIEHDPGRDLAWTTLTGVDHRLRLRIRKHGEGSRVTLRFAYDSPGVLGGLVDVVAFRSVRRAMRELLGQVEALTR